MDNNNNKNLMNEQVPQNLAQEYKQMIYYAIITCSYINDLSEKINFIEYRGGFAFTGDRDAKASLITLMGVKNKLEESIKDLIAKEL